VSLFAREFWRALSALPACCCRCRTTGWRTARFGPRTRRNETPTGATLVTGRGGVSSRRHPGRAKGASGARRLWMAGHARCLWIRDELWTGLLRPAGLFARTSRRGQRWPPKTIPYIACLGDGVSLLWRIFTPRRKACMANLPIRFSRLPRPCVAFVVCVSHARETLRTWRDLNRCSRFAWHPSLFSFSHDSSRRIGFPKSLNA
jgi:hypothetical protein